MGDSRDQAEVGGGSITLEDARAEVEIVARRLAMLHLALAKTLTEALGHEGGTRLVGEVIKRYGSMIGEEVRERVKNQGLETVPENYGVGQSRDLPRFGMHERVEVLDVHGQRRVRAYGCTLAKVWREQGEDRLGRLYCYVDPAKYMSYDPKYKLAHVRAIPDGDPFCELCVLRTTPEERRDFATQGGSWFHIDRCKGAAPATDPKQVNDR